ncbi:hypothetical protein CPB85DRAFT_611870 [Mucidula mucida]|nr:hypothetical protein CPB85DRAFT_611870 [Mucidula mucida]
MIANCFYKKRFASYASGPFSVRSSPHKVMTSSSTRSQVMFLAACCLSVPAAAKIPVILSHRTITATISLSFAALHVLQLGAPLQGQPSIPSVRSSATDKHFSKSVCSFLDLRTNIMLIPQAVHFLHAHHIAHGDISGQNIVMDVAAPEGPTRIITVASAAPTANMLH